MLTACCYSMLTKTFLGRSFISCEICGDKFSDLESGYLQRYRYHVEFARSFADYIHRDITYGDNTYIYHLDETAKIAIGLWHSYSCLRKALPEITDFVVAAYLHDGIEDANLTPEFIDYLFGNVIKNLVEAVTDCPGRNRKERKKLTYPKIKAAGDAAIALKLADRIANVEYSKKNNAGLYKMYQKEQPEFKTALYTDNLNLIWLALDVKLSG